MDEPLQIINPPRGQSSGGWLIPRQLPASTSCYTDRKHHLARLHRVFDPGPRQRLALITGEGGIGKTALVIEWARGLSDRFKDGIVFCDLHGSHNGTPADPATIAEGLLRAFGVSPARIPVDPDLRTAELRTVLANREALIVLDNAASAAQVLPLLPGDSGSVVIVTSRKQLMRLGEYGTQLVRLDVLKQDDAVTLLKEVMMAGGRQGDSEEELTELARLCAGLPLALRVAAERAISQPDMPLGDFLEELEDIAERLNALSTDEENAVRAVFSSSYGQLTADEARMFRLLGLHEGPEISRGAATAAAGLPRLRARRALESLTRANLLQSAGARRYRQHNLLRAFALDRTRATDEPGDRRDAVDRITRWYTVTAHNASKTLVPGRAFELDTVGLASGVEPDEFDTGPAAYEWFSAERPNLVASARSAFNSGLHRRAWELALVLSPLQATYFTFDDWSALSELALAAADELNDPAALASALDNRGRFLLRRGRLEEAKAAHFDALEIQESIGDEPGACRSLNALGLVFFQDRDLSEAIRYSTDAKDRAIRADQPRWYGAASVVRAHAYLESDDPDKAIEILEPLLDFFEVQKDTLNLGTAYRLIAEARRHRREFEAAGEAIARALRIATAEANEVWEADWRIESARTNLALGALDWALDDCETAVRLQRRVGDLGREAAAMDCKAETLDAVGQAEEAEGARRQAAELRERHRRDLA